MPPHKRRRPDPVVEQLRALREGGLGALLAAEQIATAADDLIQVRVSKMRKALYREAAQRAGAKSLSAWLISLADDAAKGE